MHCTEQAQNSPWARSPCLAHGQHFPIPVRVQILLLWGQLHLPSYVFTGAKHFIQTNQKHLAWNNTELPSFKLFSAKAACHCKPCPSSTQHHQLEKKMHTWYIQKGTYEKKMFKYLLYIKGPIYTTEKQIFKKQGIGHLEQSSQLALHCWHNSCTIGLRVF